MSQEHYGLPGKGLNPGDWDLYLDNVLPEENQMCCIRVSLEQPTTWDDILKFIPKGSMIKNFIRVR